MSTYDEQKDKVCFLDTNTVKGARSFLSSKSGLLSVSAISFLEAALPLPLMTDPFLIAAVLSKRKNAFRIVFYTTLASVLGGVFAYLTALFFFDKLLEFMSVGLLDQFHQMIATNTTNTFLLTITGAITPIPYTLAAWAVAALKGSLIVFIVGSCLGRGARYALVGYCTYRFGEAAVKYVRRYTVLSTLLLILVIALYIWFKM